MNTILSLNPTNPPIIHIRINPKRDWNNILKNQARLGNDSTILSAYARMESLGITPDKATLPLVFKACGRLNDVEFGKRVHASLEGTGLVEDVRVGSSILDFYCKCGFFEEGRTVFDKLNERDLVSWNAILAGCVSCHCYEETIGLFRRMQGEGWQPNSRTLVALVLAAEGVLELRVGQEIHGYCLRNGFFDLYPHVGTVLIGFYFKFDARLSTSVFHSMVVKSSLSWNAMISGYFEAGRLLESLLVFVWMLKNGVTFDLVTILIVIQICGVIGSLKLGMQIHVMAIKVGYGNDLFIVNSLLNMYSYCGSLDLAFKLFNKIPIHDVALWNSMLASYIEHGCYEEATGLFIRMQTEMRIDERTIVIMLSLCAELDDGLMKCKSLHAYAYKYWMKMDVALGNALLSIYADLNCVEDARKVFGQINKLDIISYNTMILALASSNLISQARELFEMMQESEIEPNSHTMIALLASCGDESYLGTGRSIHSLVIKHGFDFNLSLVTALTDMYMNCGDEATARDLFETCRNKDVISWNAMIASYIEQNRTDEAILLFSRMISQVEPNLVTVLNMLSCCTDLANLPEGQCLHAYATRRFSSSTSNLSLNNALITMYTRCGSVHNAEKIFKTLKRRNIISWNALVTGYSTNGCSYDAILAFKQMLEDGFQPNRISFLSVLSACRHAGLIEKGIEIFHSMLSEFRITPQMAHYGCVVDLLGRGGCLHEAWEFINYMPIEPDASVLRALLSACRLRANTKLAAVIFEKLVELEPANVGNYVLLSNIYAAAGLWSEVRLIRTWLKEKGMRKSPGISWIIIRGQVHSFASGDTSHPSSEKIYTNLNSLMALVRECGYAIDVRLLFHDEED
ncbi:hypothetical protein K2173_016382 [Erythroxylum novogranatense]|uniref:Chlororespiratory reduction 21 n=1 Tax=Erythroxylum novogranatense TaxID=1862640 RepID=A0AAV8SGS2_9ROSI|nr:hypothetical protein K2173_016382 [Erythroxylum novogranatense]